MLILLSEGDDLGHAVNSISSFEDGLAKSVLAGAVWWQDNREGLEGWQKYNFSKRAFNRLESGALTLNNLSFKQNFCSFLSVVAREFDPTYHNFIFLNLNYASKKDMQDCLQQAHLKLGMNFSLLLTSSQHYRGYEVFLPASSGARLDFKNYRLGRIKDLPLTSLLAVGFLSSRIYHYFLAQSSNRFARKLSDIKLRDILITVTMLFLAMLVIFLAYERLSMRRRRRTIVLERESLEFKRLSDL
ncbi:MAG: hypothetical protein R3B45_15135 [Bdellovibrionota bacterium]